MRNIDHKFEWTRSEFNIWCTKITSQYGYSVITDGIGDPFGDWNLDEVGYCTQIAIFIMLSEKESSYVSMSNSIETPFIEKKNDYIPC